ncbi:hypothetical protein HPB47_020246 [Ixodes persulcatus]|uniref:Uncharacterized protein n=1 Tax=Ixodes persulcatus TaxID=34615 RepID=A0AC60QG07_IXOPE|nr:hypothetical protein HPB47_020246 [Ixodes persulcatus]
MRSIFLQPETADLGDVFREKLALVSTEDQGAVRDRCFQFLRQMAIQLQQRASKCLVYTSEGCTPSILIIESARAVKAY